MATRPTLASSHADGPPTPRWLNLIVVLLLALQGVLAATSMAQKSATWDETHYLGVGAYLLRTQRWDIPSAQLHPPLSFYLNSIPLLWADYDTSEFQRGRASDYQVGIARGRRIMASAALGGETVLFWARLPTVLLGVLLGFFVYRWSSQLHGWPGGVLSLTVYSVCPNLVAHAGLFTPDMSQTAFGLISFYYIWRAGPDGSYRLAAVAGVCLGLTLLSKYSALIWPPIFIVAAMCDRRYNFGWRIRACAAAVIAAGFVLAVGYGLRLDEYWRGIVTQYTLVSTGRERSYLMGEVSYDGWWYYYLVALVVKLTVPLLLLVLAASALSLFARGIGWRDALFIWLPVVAFLGAFSLLGRVNNGIRYVLPILPFLIVWAGGLSSVLFRAGQWRWTGVCTVAVLLVWHVYAGLSIYPHYLAYFNELAGGPHHGHEWLLDSNLDWGQDLKGLASYMQANGIREVTLSYFGTADPHLYGIRYQSLPSDAALDPRYTCRQIRAGDVLAVSVNNLHGLFVDLGDLGKRLRAMKHEAVIGYSIFVYRASFTARLNWRQELPVDAATELQ